MRSFFFCYDLKCIHACIYAYRKELRESVYKLMRSKENTTAVEWMFGLPLYNFLMEHSEPYDNICTSSDGKLAENWSMLFKNFSMQNTRKKLASNSQLRQV